MSESVRRKTLQRLLAVACVILSLCVPFTAAAQFFGLGDTDDPNDGTGRVMDRANFYGYVSTRGRVLASNLRHTRDGEQADSYGEPNSAIWAEYLPGHEIVQQRCGELPPETHPGYAAASRCFSGPQMLMTPDLREQVRLNPGSWSVQYL